MDNEWYRARDRWRMTCNKCKYTCCDNLTIGTDEEPDNFKIGDWVEIFGLTLVKKENGMWKCRAFNAKEKRCMIYEYRTYICRVFLCRFVNYKRRVSPIHHIANKRQYLNVSSHNKFTILLDNTLDKLESDFDKFREMGRK